MLLHNAQELYDDFRAGADEHLAFPSFLSVVDGVERIIKNTCFDHGDNWRFSTRWWEVRYLMRPEKFHVSLGVSSRKSALDKGSSAHAARGMAIVGQRMTSLLCLLL